MMDQLTTILDEDGPEAIFEQILKQMEYHLVGEAPVGYRCSCSRERLQQALSCIDEGDLKEMAEAGEPVEVVCQFCGSKYRFSPAELEKLRENGVEKK